MTKMGPVRVIGVMSGSSLDGIDLALCHFALNGKQWSFTVEAARTVPYDAAMRQRLLEATSGDALELARLNRDIGIAIGQGCRQMLQAHSADLIASHGHTIFHQPDEGLTLQVGSGAHIAALSGLPTVCDLRSLDVALGGQGAPLVPFGERMLFPDHKAFVNLGGIANISVHHGKQPVGYDVCPCNQALDLLAAEAGKPYDADGALARAGEVDLELLAKLNALPFYAQAPPRSLGREWFEEKMKPLITTKAPLENRLRTVTEHVALLIARELDNAKVETALFTGGGAHNGFLIERIAALGKAKPELPSAELINYKEAVIFAFLGLMRLRGEVNTLASVTGASRDSIGGAVYLPINTR
ncbi:MAG: anhydro-N-acetylmuramic acid kinase [Flavobacteriales bacterium]|jgi:anhydro-N-acetylmuramic acid kinase|nr:anhydro-N-acetylmuramic acid kinase [Flavobacteriales bacterium]MCB0757558.1 anhydro-N-acetylmuramic acid kinase [Flavobacteriales bacterium]